MNSQQPEQQRKNLSDENLQPKSTRDERPGYGNKKLEGPNRPAE